MLQVDGRSNRGRHRAGRPKNKPDARPSIRGIVHTIMSSWPELEMTCACRGELASWSGGEGVRASTGNSDHDKNYVCV